MARDHDGWRRNATPTPDVPSSPLVVLRNTGSIRRVNTVIAARVDPAHPSFGQLLRPCTDTTDTLALKSERGAWCSIPGHQ